MGACMSLSVAQQDLQMRARALAREVIAPHAAETDRTEQYPWANVKALTNAGFFGMTIPKQYGGPGLGFLEASLVVDDMAEGFSPSVTRPRVSSSEGASRRWGCAAFRKRKSCFRTWKSPTTWWCCRRQAFAAALPS